MPSLPSTSRSVTLGFLYDQIMLVQIVRNSRQAEFTPATARAEGGYSREGVV
jgi:hypothetical protein